MKKKFLLVVLICLTHVLAAQTSWKGTTSTVWGTASNWTAGVPVSTVDAIIGDANFTGSFQPQLTQAASCKSLTIGTGSIVSTLTVARNITVSGAVVIGSNGTILHNTVNTTITVRGNWTNSGSYSSSASSATITFSGTAQTLTGTMVINQLIVNSGSTLTLSNGITVNTSASITGTLDPTASNAVSGTGSLTVNSGGSILVKAADFSSNYSLSGTITLNGKGTVNYASSSINQTITNALTYGYLRISGGMTKTLTGNLPALNSSSTTSGRIYIDAGTLDLLTYTANRGAGAGGALIMTNGATLKIGGTNGFPTNYSTVTLPSNCTVEYCGTNQTVTNYTYGNLSFSSSSGAVVKTMPGTAMTIAGNFTSAAGAGTGVSFTAGNNITVNRNVSFDASTTFSGNSNSHRFRGNWTNNGTFTGNTSTVTFSGTSAVLSGTGTNNFNNLSFTGVGITASGTTTINVSGNLSTSITGTFTHSSPGTLTMTGTSKTITRNGFHLNDLSVTGTVSTTSNIEISGDFTVNGSFSATGGTITMSGTSKTIAGSGTIGFSALNCQGTISTAKDFTISSNLTVSLSGSLSASAGTVTVTGTTNFSGTANLYNVTVNNGRTLRMGTNSVLGIGNVFTLTGSLNVTTNVPNTVNYNSSGAQTVVNTAYSNLILSGGGTKTAAGAITVNNDFTTNSGVTFDASSFTFSIYRHFTNSGIFTAGTSTVQLLGGNVAHITGTTTFNNLTVNKNSATISVDLFNSISTNNLTMTAGNMQTGSNSITITGTRSGNGIIIGIIVHDHSFINGTTYYFEGPNNAITFTSPVLITSVTVTVSIGIINDFNTGVECVTREYNISIPSGTYASAILSLHYEDNELNAFDEPNLSQYHYNTSTSIWDSIGVTSRNTTTNYVEKTGITTVAGRWAMSGLRNVVRWNGSVSSAWENASNWTTISGSNMSNRVPVSTDDAQIGQGTFVNNPTISSAQTVNILRFGSVQNALLTINSGSSLTCVGGAKGLWTAAASHTIDVTSGTFSIGTTFELSDGTNGHDINLVIGTGSVSIANDLNQSATSSIAFTGSGTLSVGADYNYTSGTFSCGTGTVDYTGTEAQTVVAALTYYNLIFTKPTERATIYDPVIVLNNVTTSLGGELEVTDSLTVAGNMTVGASNTVLETGTRINIGGNFTNNGNLAVTSGTINFNGSGNQSVNANTFSTMMVNKPSGTLSLTGDLVINSDLFISSGTLDLGTLLADRSNPGGTLTMGASAILKLAGATNFPNNYISTSIDPASTVEYNGTVAQQVVNIIYGNLITTNGGGTAKTLLGSIQVNGNFQINSGSTFDPDSNTIILYGNLTVNGTYLPDASTLVLKGTSKTISGSSTLSLYSLDVIGGTYSVTCSTVTIAGDVFVDDAPSACDFTTATITLDGDLTNKGSLASSGTLTMSGNRVQTFQLINSIASTSTGVVNFNGTIAPVFNSNSSPTFYTVNINNTGGITPSAAWIIITECNIAAGVTVDWGALTHTFFRNFSNSGTSISSGKMKFNPGAPFSASGTATLETGGGTFTSTGEVEFAGTGALTVAAINPSLNNVTVTNTNAAGVTAPVSLTIAQNLYIGPGATFNAGAALSHTIAGNLTDNGTLNGNTATITFNGAPVSIDGVGATTFNNLAVQSGADVILNKSIAVTGNFTNNGTFTGTGRTVSFSGSTASVISGTTSPITLGDVEQNKTGAATTTLSVPVVVTGDLTLTDGIINTTSTNLLTLNDNATSTSGTTTSYISGPMKKIGDDAFVFPIGKSAYWARIGISAPASTGAEFQAEYNAAAYTNTSSVAAPLDHVSKVEHWILNRTAGSDNVDVTLYWESGSRSGIDDLTDIYVARFDGTNWTDETQNGGVTGTTSAGTVASQPVTSFSPFTFASKRAGVNPLPVEFLNFEATTNKKNNVELSWSTANELNSDYFLTERSPDGINFESFDKTPAAGNSSTLKNYFTKDEEPFCGTSFYRLKQYDRNGQFFYSKIASVTINNDVFSIYPNPAFEKLTVRIEGNKDKEALVLVRDLFGKVFYSRSFFLSGNDGTIDISIPEILPAGTYIVTVSSDKKTVKRKIIILNHP